MTPRHSWTPGRNRRRHAREATRLPAVVRFGDGAAVRCEILDYCPTGLYLAFVETGDHPVERLVGETVRVGFPVGTGPDTASFQLIGRVAHATAVGIGAFVPEIPESALRLLMSGLPEVDRTASASTALALSSQQSAALQNECADLLRSFLTSVEEDFFRRATERLGAAVEGGLTLKDRSIFFAGTQELIQRRDRIRQQFIGAVLDRLPGRCLQESDRDPSIRADQLTLVEKTELEDSLELAAVIDRIDASNAAQIRELERRVGRLIGVPTDRKSNPFGPEAICRAFRDSIQGMDFERPVRSILFQTLGQAIARHAAELYRELNDRLAPLGLVKPARPTPSSQPAADASAAPAGSGSLPLGSDEFPDLANATSLGRAAEIGCAGPGEQLGLDQSLANKEGWRRHAASLVPATPLPPVERQRSASRARNGLASGPDLLDLVQRLRRNGGQLAALAVHGVQLHALERAKDGSILPPASLQELLGALDSLPQVARAAPRDSAPTALADALATRLASDVGGAKGIAPEAREALESVFGLLGEARGDFAPASDLGSLVDRLERPLLKLALKDERFPCVPDHPARNVLNLIDRYAAAADDRGRFFDPNLQRYLHRLVERIVLRADQDPHIFETAGDKLGRGLSPILQARRTRVARIQESCESRQRVRTAKARVDEALDRRLGGRSVSAAVLSVLDAGWRQYLVLLATRQDTQGDVWEAALGVLDRLAARLVAPAQSPDRAIEEDLGLLDEIRGGLATVSVDGHLLDAFLDELEGELAGVDTPDRQSQAQVPIPPGKLGRVAGDNGEIPAELAKLSDKLRVGDWWDFRLESMSVPMQLVWMSTPPGRCAFANRSGTDRLELTLAKLADKIRSGVAKLGRDLDLPLVERSEIALFDDTYRQLMHQATYDPVTHLPNRKGFVQSLAQFANECAGDEVHTVCIIEFDQFRTIYDTCGVEAAEELARELANTTGEARDNIGANSVIAAFRDDTLALLVPRCASSDCSAASALLARFKDYRFQHRHHRYSIGVNIGLAEYSPPAVTAEEAVRRADSACIAAKSLGRNRIQVYEQASPELKSQESLMEWAGRIDFFLEGSGLYLRCQRVVPVAAQSPLLPYCEILLGIRGDSGQEISPVNFIPAVTRLNRAHELDIWVIRKVFHWIEAQPAAFASLGGVAINLSATSLGHPEVTECILRLLESRPEVSADKIIFEITESAAVESYATARDFIREIRRYGCKFSLDDFGTGFTSYAHLKNLRTDTLKIDGSFVKDMLENPGDCAMVESMNEIAHSLGLQTVAEYVESAAILDKLREIGVDYAQGYAIHKPCPIDAIIPDIAT